MVKTGKSQKIEPFSSHFKVKAHSDRLHKVGLSDFFTNLINGGS